MEEIGTLSVTARTPDGQKLNSLNPIFSIPDKGFSLPTCASGVFGSSDTAYRLMQTMTRLPIRLRETGHQDVVIHVTIDGQKISNNIDFKSLQQQLLAAHRNSSGKESK